MMCASNDKLLVVTQQLTRASYMETGHNQIAEMNEVLNLEREKSDGLSLVSIHLVSEYIVAVFDTAVTIYKQTGQPLQ